MARDEVNVVVGSRAALLLFRSGDPLLEELLRRLRELGLDFEGRVIYCG